MVYREWLVGFGKGLGVWWCDNGEMEWGFEREVEGIGVFDIERRDGLWVGM